MSYDPEDRTRARFLDDLSRSACNVTISEARFIEQLGEVEEFSPEERKRIDRLRERFARELRGRKS